MNQTGNSAPPGAHRRLGARRVMRVSTENLDSVHDAGQRSAVPQRATVAQRPSASQKQRQAAGSKGENDDRLLRERPPHWA